MTGDGQLIAWRLSAETSYTMKKEAKLSLSTLNSNEAVSRVDGTEQMAAIRQADAAIRQADARR